MRTVFVIVVLLCSRVVLAQQISDIKIENNKKTKTAFLLKQITAKEGRLLDSVKVEKDILRLKRLPAIANASYKVVLKANNTCSLIYDIEDNHTLIPNLNIYTTNNDEFAFRLGLYEFNALGRNITIGGFYQEDIFSSFGLNFRAPNLFTANLGLAVNYQDLTTQEPVFLDAGTANYRYNNKSIEVLGLYQLGFNNRFTLGFNVFSEAYNYLDGETAPNVPQDFKVDKNLLRFEYQFSNLLINYQYRSGIQNTLQAQYVQSANAVLPDFLIWWNDFNFYKRIGKRGNWASRLRLGLATNADSPFAPFAVDNNLNIRGVGNTIDRGTGVIVLNTEYRHTLIDKDWFVLQSNVFVDSGSWRNPGGDFGDFSKRQNFRVYPGVGIRLIHKRIFNAVFRIDYGFGITPDATRGFVFGIGQYF